MHECCKIKESQEEILKHKKMKKETQEHRKTEQQNEKNNEQIKKEIKNPLSQQNTKDSRMTNLHMNKRTKKNKGKQKVIKSKIIKMA